MTKVEENAKNDKKTSLQYNTYYIILWKRTKTDLYDVSDFLFGINVLRVSLCDSISTEKTFREEYA